MSINKVHLDIKIYGRVQGVGYRAYASRWAKEHHVAGYVKNMPDGHVFIEAEGEWHNLKGFIDKCFKGPNFGKVEKMEKMEAPIVGYSKFQIF